MQYLKLSVKFSLGNICGLFPILRTGKQHVSNMQSHGARKTFYNVRVRKTTLSLQEKGGGVSPSEEHPVPGDLYPKVVAGVTQGARRWQVRRHVSVGMDDPTGVGSCSQLSLFYKSKLSSFWLFFHHL